MTLHAHAGPGRRYQVHGPVGRGGFGTVYRADMLGDDGFVRAVALKVLNPDVAETGEVARRFRDEARVLGLLRHRAIVQVDGLVYLGERQALVMEFIDGADLGRIMALGPVAPGPALEIIGEVANALDVAYHTPGPDGQPLGLLHRDVKPSNIRVTPAGEVKVLDFGVARAEFGEREANTKSYLLGSNGYMGPERFEGEDGPATDVYSLGVVLLEMLTGQSFGPTSIRPAKLAARVQEALNAGGGFAPELEDLVRRMISFEPADRPSAAEIERTAWELHRSLEGERLRDWARGAVQEAAAKPVKANDDDLSGRVLSEVGGGNTPAPTEPDAVADPADPAQVSGPTPAAARPAPAPVRRAAPAPEFLPPVDEWDDEQPTVVAGGPQDGGRAGVANLARPAPAPTPAPTPGPSSLPPAAEPVDEPHIDRTPLPRPRPMPKAQSAPPPPVARTAWLGAAVGGGLAAILAGLVLVSMIDAFRPAPEPTPVPVAPPVEAAEVAPTGPEPTPREGVVEVRGDVPSIRLVSVDGRRNRAGLLKPGTYLVSADFGAGAKPAGRLELAVGERVIVDCSQAATACSVYRE